MSVSGGGGIVQGNKRETAISLPLTCLRAPPSLRAGGGLGCHGFTKIRTYGLAPYLSLHLWCSLKWFGVGFVRGRAECAPGGPGGFGAWPGSWPPLERLLSTEACESANVRPRRPPACLAPRAFCVDHHDLYGSFAFVRVKQNGQNPSLQLSLSEPTAGS